MHESKRHRMRLPTPVLKAELPVTPEDALQGLVESTYTTSTLEFYLNGTRIQLQNPNPHWTLLDFIRSQHGLKGTKLGCGEGGCGACTVVLQTSDSWGAGRIRHLAVNACLYPLIGGTCDNLNGGRTGLTQVNSGGKACHHRRRSRLS